MNGVKIVRACDRHSNETVTLRKHDTEYKTMLKWIVEFLRKLEGRAIKLLELTQFASPNLQIYFNFVLLLESVVILTLVN